MQYYSTHPIGFSKICSKILLELDPRTQIHKQGLDYIYYSSELSIERVKSFLFFEQTLLLVKYFENNDKDFSKQVDWFYRNSTSVNFKLSKLGNNNTYRIVGSAKGLDNGRIQTEINQLDRVVRIDRGNADFDIRINEKDDHGLIGVRITQPAEFADYLQRGSVRKEIAYYMLHLSEMKNEDVFLDPFCGGGIIPMLRAQVKGYKEIIASDKTIDQVTDKVNRTKLDRKSFKILKSSLEDLQKTINKKVSKIVTDPPWGLIEKVPDQKTFYIEMFNQLDNLAVNDAVIVLLTPHLEVIKEILEVKQKKFEILETISGKISGRDSNIIKIRKF